MITFILETSLALKHGATTYEVHFGGYEERTLRNYLKFLIEQSSFTQEELDNCWFDAYENGSSDALDTVLPEYCGVVIHPKPEYHQLFDKKDETHEESKLKNIIMLA